MITYKLPQETNGVKKYFVLKITDGIIKYIPLDIKTTEYQQYQNWLLQGNVPGIFEG